MSKPNKLLSFGDENNRKFAAPKIGETFQTEKVTLSLIPAKPYVVNFQAPDDVISITLGSLKGESKFDSDRLSPMNIPRGNLTLHPKNSSVYVKGSELQAGFVGISLPAAIRQQMAEEFGNPSLNQINTISEAIKVDGALSLAQQVRQFILAGHPGGSMVAESLGIVVMGKVLHALNKKCSDFKPKNGLSAIRVNIVYDLVEANLGLLDLSLNTLAEHVGLTPYHFLRSFKQAAGTTPHQYIQERRLVRARELLATSNIPLANIAYDLGFSSQAHMTSAFRAKLGTTPGKYRNDLS